MGRNWPTLDEMREVLGGVLSPVWGELQIVQGGVQYLGLGAEQKVDHEDRLPYSVSRPGWMRQLAYAREQAAKAEHERFWKAGR